MFTPLNIINRQISLSGNLLVRLMFKCNVTDKSIKTLACPPSVGKMCELTCSSVYMTTYTKYICNLEKSASITI